MLYSGVLYSDVLYSEVLYSEVLYGEVLYSEVLYSEVLYSLSIVFWYSGVATRKGPALGEAVYCTCKTISQIRSI